MNLAQGFTPAISVTITGLVIDSVVRAINIHSTAPIWVPIGLQLGITLLSSLLSNLSNIVQQLLQEQVSNRVQLEILKKANTLDLAFFENPEFYDKMRQAARIHFVAGATSIVTPNAHAWIGQSEEQSASNSSASLIGSWNDMAWASIAS